MSVYTLMQDFAIAGAFILIGQFLRAKITVFQKLFLPASLIAGIIGMALGPNGLNVIPFSADIGSYASALIMFIFVSIGLKGIKLSSKGLKGEGERAGSYVCHRLLAQALQFCLPIIFSILIISRIDPKINYGFGLLVAAGFFGGHGTAASVGATFAELGWADATDLAMTSATVGMLTGVIGGLIFIHWATKKGYTQYIKDFTFISGDLRTSLYSKENRPVAATETVSNTSLNSLCFHFSFMLIPMALGYYINKTFIKPVISIPAYIIAFVVSILMYFLLGNGEKGVYKYVDKRYFSHISGTATDFLVFFGITTTKVPVIIKYALPFGLLMLFGIGLCVFTMRILGPAMNNESWFERCLFAWGAYTGVVATGFILLRIVDPENHSKTLNDVAITTPLCTLVELFAWGFGPLMLMSGQHWLFVGVYALEAIILFAITRACKFWYTKIPLSERKAVEDTEE